MENKNDTFVLRDYQKECEQAIENAGAGKYLVVMATGLGKTAVFTHMDSPGRTLILSHRDELVRQPERYYKGRKSFGIEKADEHASDEEIVSASVQSLQQSRRLANFSEDAFDTIIVDEAHHAAAEGYRKILNHFSGARRVIGFTATPKRGDSVRLDDIFEKIIFVRDIRWGIENGYLSRIRCKQIYSDYSLKGIDLTAGDYSISEIDKAFLSSNTLPVAAKAYYENCHITGRHTLIYCTTRNICTILCEMIRKLLPEEEKETVKVLTGLTSSEERAKILTDFQSGTVKAIINCMVLTEGTDLLICDAILNLRPTCNMSLYQQMVGRGTRLSEGKEYCLVLDVVPEDNPTHRTLCTAPTLFGIEAALLDKKTKQKLNEQEDLLELCNSLSEAFASEAEKIKLQSTNVNLFIEEVEGLIQNTEAASIKNLASDYSNLENSKRSAQDLVDFGNLDVHIQSDERRYYRIVPSWEEEIFMSKPDVLNNVHVEFQLEYGQIRQADMKLKQALELIRMYCETRPWYYGYSWNLDMQKEWSEIEATDAQQSKVEKMYQKLDLDTSSVSSLNKIEASKLIDLANRLKDAKKYAEALELYQNSKNTKKV